MSLDFLNKQRFSTDDFELDNFGNKKVTRLNRQHIPIVKNKEFGKFCIISDVHWGSYFCNQELFKEYVEKIFDEKIPTLFLGDIIEMSNKYSISDGVYKQIIPEKQADFLWYLFEEFKKENLILGAAYGNHEKRLFNHMGFEVTRYICSKLNIPYLGTGGWNIFYCGNQSYSIYAIHGKSGSTTKGGKLNAVAKLLHTFQADIAACGHVHELDTYSILVERINKKAKTIEKIPCYVVITGHYYNYEQSYGCEKGYSLTRQGSPFITLGSNERNIKINLTIH